MYFGFPSNLACKHGTCSHKSHVFLAWRIWLSCKPQAQCPPKVTHRKCWDAANGLMLFQYLPCAVCSLSRGAKTVPNQHCNTYKWDSIIILILRMTTCLYQWSHIHTHRHTLWEHLHCSVAFISTGWVRLPGFKDPPHHLLCKVWTQSWASLCLSLFIYKMGIIITSSVLFWNNTDRHDVEPFVSSIGKSFPSISFCCYYCI